MQLAVPVAIRILDPAEESGRRRNREADSVRDDSENRESDRGHSRPERAQKLDEIALVAFFSRPSPRSRCCLSLSKTELIALRKEVFPDDRAEGSGWSGALAPPCEDVPAGSVWKRESLKWRCGALFSSNFFIYSRSIVTVPALKTNGSIFRIVTFLPISV